MAEKNGSGAGKNSTGAAGKRLAALAGAAALGSAAAAGYYFFMSKSAKQHRRIAASWATNMKRDVVRQAKKIQNIDKKAFLGIVNAAAQTYAAARNIDKREIERAARELKENWQNVIEEAGIRVGEVRKALTKSRSILGKSHKKAPKKATKSTKSTKSAKKSR